MKPTKFHDLVERRGKTVKYREGQVFHAQHFPQKLFLLYKGYVKRYQATKPEKKVLELIYGPEHIISLSHLYKKLFGVDQNQDSFIYIYQAMTDVEMGAINFDIVIEALKEDPSLYGDFFYESGLKLKANIARLASNSLKDDYQKVAHQLVSLAYEFAEVTGGGMRKKVNLPLPQSPVDVAEQLNISKEVAGAVMDSLSKNKVIKMNGSTVTILDIDLLKDVYL